MSQTVNAAIAVVGIDIGKNSFHIVGHDERGAIVLIGALWPTNRDASRCCASRRARWFGYVGPPRPPRKCGRGYCHSSSRSRRTAS